MGVGKGGGGTREAEGNGAAGCPFASRHIQPRRAATPYYQAERRLSDRRGAGAEPPRLHFLFIEMLSGRTNRNALCQARMRET